MKERIWINRVTSELVFQPSCQSHAFAALPFFFCLRDVTCHVKFCAFERCTDIIPLYP